MVELEAKIRLQEKTDRIIVLETAISRLWADKGAYEPLDAYIIVFFKEKRKGKIIEAKYTGGPTEFREKIDFKSDIVPLIEIPESILMTATTPVPEDGLYAHHFKPLARGDWEFIRKNSFRIEDPAKHFVKIDVGYNKKGRETVNKGKLLICYFPEKNWIDVKKIDEVKDGIIYTEPLGHRQKIRFDEDDIIYDLNKSAKDNERKWWLKSFLENFAKDKKFRGLIEEQLRKDAQVLMLRIGDEYRLREEFE